MKTSISKNILLVIVVFFTLQINAQLTIKKSSIDSGGAKVENNGLTMLYTVGEVAVGENDNGTVHVSEGFISPELFNTVGIFDFGILDGVNVYPNPASDILLINFSEESDFFVEIYTIDGKQLYKKNIENQLSHSIDLQYYPASIYLIIVKDITNKTYKSYKLIKN